MNQVNALTRYVSFAVALLLIALANSSRVSAQDDGGGGGNPPVDPGTGVTVQLPVTGVSIDAAGVLSTRAVADPTGKLTALRRKAVQAQLPGDLKKASPLRKISLKRLQQAIEQQLDAGRPLTEEIKHLVGLTRLEFLIISPDQSDIILAGPAEPWMDNLAGRVVGVQSGKPTVLLEDLLTALRVFEPGQNPNRWVGCSIDPTPNGITRLKEFQRSLPARVADYARVDFTNRVAKGMQDSLGLAQIRVYGVPRQTHLAQVIVEADYRMKLIAVGREPAPIRMTTFISALKGAPRNMQRWWFNPNYQCVRQADDGLAIQLVGQGVQLSTENIVYTDQAQIVQTKEKPSRAARQYSRSFTEQFEKIAHARPVFGQLRNMIDLLVASAWLLKNNAFEKAGWSPGVLLDEGQLPTQTVPDARTAQSVSNAVWKKNILILPAGGGVSIAAAKAFAPENLINTGKSRVNRIGSEVGGSDENWWWD